MHAWQAFWHWFAAGGWGWLAAAWFLGVFGWIGERWREMRQVRHQRRLEIEQARAPRILPPANVTQLRPPRPGRCVHRNVVPVMSDDELEPEVLAWLCRSCDTRLPPDWAVREQDL
jgi:hypothetical protein